MSSPGVDRMVAYAEDLLLTFDWLTWHLLKLLELLLSVMALTESFEILSQVACKKLLKERGIRIILGNMVSCHLTGFLFNLE